MARARRKPSLTRPVLAGLYLLRHRPGADEVLEFALGPKARAIRKITQRNLEDLRRAEEWLDGMIEWAEAKRPGIKRRVL